MATNVQRAQAVIQAALDAVPTAQQQQNVADAFVKLYPANFTPADPLNPTNEEKAECFIRSLRQWGKSVLNTAAQKDVIEPAKQTAQTAGQNAESDF